MKNFYKKTLIISPHSDDEIFTLPFIYSPDNNFESIDLLLIENDPSRFRECSSSCKKHGFNLIRFPTNFAAKGLFFYELIDDLVNYFSDLEGKYDLILSPIIEGGHQDHDSVCLAILKVKDFLISKTKIIFYSTYRNLDIFPILYTCGFSEKVPKDKIFSVKMPFDIFFILFSTVLFYKSQLRTWILLAPTIFISILKRNFNKFFLANDFNLGEVVNLIPEKPLYQTYRKLSKRKWIELHRELFDSLE